MSFRFITSVLTAGALVATLSAAPARANNHDDVGKFIGAAATLFILGTIIDSETRKKREKAKATQHAHKPQAKQPPVQTQHKTPQRKPKAHIVTPRRQGQGAGRALLPNQCLIPVNGGNTRFVMGRRCLNNNYRSAQRLPQACMITLRGARHDRPVYSLRCLRDRGYKVAGWQ